MENGNKRKQQLPFVFCKWKIESQTPYLFPANENGKRTFVILFRQTINGN
jgi:hypothetical protein